VARMDGPAIHSSMLWPLLIMAIGFTALYFALMVVRLRGEIAAMKVRNIRLGQVQA